VVAQTRSLARIAKFIGPPLAACFFALLAIGLLIAAWLQGRAENMLATEQLLVAAAGPLPGIDVENGQADIDRQARSLRWKLSAVLVGFPFVIFAVEQAVRRVWPGASELVQHAGVVTFVALVCLGIWLWGRHRRRSVAVNAERPRPSRFREAMWGPAKWVLIVAIVVPCGFVPFGWLNRLIPIAALAELVRLALFILLITLIVSGRDIAAVFVVKPAWRAGDYERAMRWIRLLRFGWPSASLLKMEGLTHALANRSAEAERCYRQALVKSHTGSRAFRAELLGRLGDVLTDQGRYEEAKKCLQGCIGMGDNIVGSARVDLAELLLKQGSEPGTALELVDEAMRIAKGPIAAKVEPSRWAVRAWALALLGRRQEAEQAIERALVVRRSTLRALFASTHLKVGMALLAMDQPEKAIEHFRAAYEADPKGKYGARALQQIQRHGAGSQ
jgi:tetratricopeptide (TPR) repeat protein